MLTGEDRPVTWNHRNMAAGCAWSPNGKVIASADSTGLLYLRLRQDPTNKLAFSSHGRYLSVLRFSPDGSRLAVGGIDGTVDLWDTSAILEHSNRERDAPSELAVSLPSSVRPVLLRTIKAHFSGGVTSLAFSADGTRLASHANGVSKLWDLSRIQGRYEVADFGEDLFSGRLGLSFNISDQGVKVESIDSQDLDVVSGEIGIGDRIIEISDDTHGVTELSDINEFDARRLLRGPHRSVVRLTVQDESRVRREVTLRRMKKEDPRSIRLCFSRDGTTVAIAGQKHGTSTINIATGRTQRYPIPSSDTVAISHDSRLLAMDGRTEVLVWDMRKDQEHARLDARVSTDLLPTSGGGGSLAFSPDGKFLVIGTGYPYNPAPKRSDLIVWRVGDLQKVGGKPVFKHDHVLSDITFSPDSTHCIATCHDGTVRVWNTESWELLDRQFVTGSESRAIAISSDGKTLAAGCREQIILWDFSTGKKLRVLNGPSPWSLDFSSDGKTLVSGGSNHSVILWDVATGMQLRTFHAHTDAVMGVAFSPDGNTLATVGSEGVLRLWEAATFEEIERYPSTLEAMFRLATLRTSEDRYEEAERILTSLLSLQQKHLPAGHRSLERTQAEIKKAVEAQRLPAHPPPLNSEP